MEVMYKLNDKLTFLVEGATQKEIFNKVAEIVKDYVPIFGLSRCGCCKSTNIVPVVRQAKDSKKKDKFHSYYEYHCKSNTCQARFSIGQLLEGGGLFPKLKNDNKEWLPDNGWSTDWKKFVEDKEPVE